MKALSRREFIKLSTLSLLGVGIAACAPATTAPANTSVPATSVSAATSAPAATAVATKAPAATTAPAATKAPAATMPPAAKYKEAPMLAAMVTAGKLPPIDQRLPTNPIVIPPADGFKGVYGGVLRFPYQGFGNRWHVRELIRETAKCVVFDDKMNLIPHQVESFDISSDAKVWTFHLRKGAKWSNGKPFTSADYKWTYDHYIINTDLVSAGTNWKDSWRQVGPDGKVVNATIETPDETTVKLTYSIAQTQGVYFFKEFMPLPSDYVKQFHMDTTSDKAVLDKAVKDGGFKTWQDLFDNQCWYALNPEVPMMNPWVPDKTKMPAELFVTTRNPYFMGVDPDGNQLPYIDQQQYRLYEQTDTMKLWMLNGEVDMWPEVVLGDVQAFKDAETKSGATLVKNNQAAHTGMQLNMTSKDKRLREFFQKRDVRIAISLSANRDEMNQLLTLGLAVPRNYSPIKSSPNYYEKATTAYIQYDVNKANELLDGAGYKDKNAKGQRLWPGTQEPISWILEQTADPGTLEGDSSNLVVKYLAAVGLTMTAKPVARTLYDQHTTANDLDAGFWGGDRCFMPLLSPSIFQGRQIDRAFDVAWALWKNNPGNPPPAAEEPPADHWIKKIWAIWDQIAAEPDTAKKNALFVGILDIWATEVPMICYVGDWVLHTYIHKGIHNLKAGTTLDWGTNWIALLALETLSYEDPANQSTAKLIA